jgi:hypothetical protein
MNGFLGTGLGLGELLLLLMGLVAAIMVVKFTVTFDLNRFLDGRRARYSQRLINACPHVTGRVVGAEFVLQSEMVSPPGTTMHLCQRCGLQKYLSPGDEQERLNYLANNPKQLARENSRFMRLLRRSGQL